MLLIKESVLSFEEKTTQPWFTYFQIAGSTKTLLRPVKYYFEDFILRLLAYRTQFSCLYLPQGHTFISTMWL